MTQLLGSKLITADGNQPKNGLSPSGFVQSNWRNPKDYLVPSTFEERGASVPFTTPKLLHARARLNWRGKLELSIGRFAESSGSYVVPWNGIGEMISLTVHDVMLYDALRDKNNVDPHVMRLAALQIAADGFAGPEATDAAIEALAADAQAKALNQVVIILAVIKRVEKALAEDLFRDIRSSAGQARIREAFRSIGDRLNLNAVDFEQKLSALGERTYVVGATWSPEKGKIRRLMAKLVAFRKSTENWGAERLGEAADQAQFCSEVAAHTLMLTTNTLAKFDHAIKNPLAVLYDWDIKAPRAEHMAMRLSWLLDGWESIIAIWTGVTAEFDQIRVLSQIVSDLPIVPKNEIDDSDTLGTVDELNRTSRRWVRAQEDWRTGEMDLEMVHRIELMRAKNCD